MGRLQLGQQAGKVAELVVLGRRYLVPRQGVELAALARLFRCHRGGEADVRGDTLVLGAATVDPVELGDGVLHVTKRLLVEVINLGEAAMLLHRALAKRVLAEDQGAAVILHGGSEDLGGRGAVAVDHHRHGAAVVDVAVVITVDGDAAHVIPDLHHRAAREEQAAQGRGLGQRTAAVATQIDDQTLDLLLVEAGELLDHVVVQVDVEARDLEHADLLALGGDHLGLGGPVFQTHLVTYQLDLLGLGAGALAALDLQLHLAALGPLDELDHVIETPADHVDNLAVVLPYPDDLVIRFQVVGLGSRAARHQGANDGEVIFGLQHGTNPLQREVHLGVETIGAARRQIAGVRLDGASEGVHEELEYILALGLGHPLDGVVVTLAEQLLDLGPLLAAELEAQGIELDPLAPQLVEFGLVFRPGRPFPIKHVVVGLGKIERSIEQFEGVFEPLITPLLTQVEHLVGRCQPPSFEVGVKAGTVLFKTADVRGQKQVAAVIQILQILVKDHGGKGIVQLELLVMRAGKQIGNSLASRSMLALLSQHRQITFLEHRLDGLCKPGKRQATGNEGKTNYAMLQHLSP